jgi:uncharacterized protein (DUF58 family)
MSNAPPDILLTDDDLLPPAFMRQLERLRLCSRVIHPGASMGERISRARGSGMEFSDHKEYSPGDDFRMIDWNVYARLDELVVKLFETEENLSVCVLLDASSSMDFGRVAEGIRIGAKWAAAARLAAAISYIAMVNRDALTMFLFAGQLGERLEALRGRGHVRQMLNVLSLTRPAGRSDFPAAFRSAGAQLHRPGVCFVISDFCAGERLAEAFRGLVYFGHEIVALHVTDELEADPGLEGEIDIVDAETGEVVPMTVRPDTRQRYRQAYESRCRGVAAACATYDAKYLRLSTAEPVTDIVLNRFRREGILE